MASEIASGPELMSFSSAPGGLRSAAESPTEVSDSFGCRGFARPGCGIQEFGARGFRRGATQLFGRGVVGPFRLGGSGPKGCPPRFPDKRPPLQHVALHGPRAHDARGHMAHPLPGNRRCKETRPRRPVQATADALHAALSDSLAAGDAWVLSELK